MLKKVLSLSAVTAILVGSVSCGSTTTSMYNSRKSLGDQISNNISKLMDNSNDVVTKTPYNTYNTGNRLYTNNNNGYVNNYDDLNDEYNYNGVVLNNTNGVELNNTNSMSNNTRRLQNNLSNLTVKKSNTLTKVPATNTVNDVDNTTVKKTNTLTKIPTSDVADNSNTINRVLNTIDNNVDNVVDDVVDNTTITTPRITSVTKPNSYTTTQTRTNVADTSVSPMIIA